MILAGELRAWAKGSYPFVAATELLLHGFGSDEDDTTSFGRLPSLCTWPEERGNGA
jgi:hypothetical protein